MNIDRKCVCGAMWKARGIPEDVAEKIILEWELAHNTHTKKSLALSMDTFYERNKKMNNKMTGECKMGIMRQLPLLL